MKLIEIYCFSCFGFVKFVKILFFGDIIGRPGREAVKEILPRWQEKYKPDLIIANGENLAHGKGVTRETLNEILFAGIDVVTSGNHIWKNKEADDLLRDKNIFLLRPLNMHPDLPGDGFKIIEVRTKKIMVVNLIGRLFMHSSYDDPFRKIDDLLNNYSLSESANKDKVDAIIVDWHAEATSEKEALGWYLNGRVSAVLGTHIHVSTSDEKILPDGTGYISDVGAVRVRDSILGLDHSLIIDHFIKQIPIKPELALGPVEVNAVLIEVNKKGLCDKIERLKEICDIL